MTEPEQKLMVPDARQERSSRAVTAIGDVQNPMQLLAIAVNRGASIEELQKLMDLKDRWEKREAEKAYTQAIVEFKANPPKILKTKLVSFDKTSYKHATLGGVTDAIIEGLSKVGISHRWTVEQPDKTTIRVTCTLTHRLGHSESVSLVSAPDTSGSKNSIQSIGSAVAYLSRYTILAATGLATFDDDGRGTEPKADKIREANKPAGYDKWAADIGAKADEGTDALKKAWKGSKAEFREFASADGSWWADQKARAAAVNGGAK